MESNIQSKIVSRLAKKQLLKPHTKQNSQIIFRLLTKNPWKNLIFWILTRKFCVVPEKKRENCEWNGEDIWINHSEVVIEDKNAIHALPTFIQQQTPQMTLLKIKRNIQYFSDY
ncbi:CLUMA_CG017793, isoform A [Clunio marinus]|uniref:CLUMA_CG017793, isoform A n=1 Tax=Clunio marinus TaxID=568069 RepID=A0A1J1IX01_9DIPT|nr:CLUMA_CG017793, isoform A [Clunio marinus]